MASSRREWLRNAGVGMAALWSASAWCEGLPEITRPRATSGDAAVEPAWDERLTVTVGPKEADIVGATDKTIQAAVDYLLRYGGGTVRVLPGEYRLRNAVRLQAGIRLLGSGGDSVLLKEPSIATTLAEDSDWFDQEITLENPDGFRVGDGVCLIVENVYDGRREVTKRTLIAQSGNRFKLDKGLRVNYWREKKPSVSTLFPMITAEETADFAIEDLVLDGNRANNANLDGNYAGCIWLQDCSRVQIRGVEARNYNGDGMSWQICHDVLVEHCHSHGHAGLGLHPGSGAQRSVMRNNRLEKNSIGLFFCWGVKYGLAENNIIADNSDCGVSIGHRDDENIVRNNEILRSGKTGLLFRPERGEGYTAKGNRIENNRIIDSGPEDGVAVDIQGVTAGNVLVGNTINETRGPASRIGIRIGKEAGENRLENNEVTGFGSAMQDLRKQG
jgi:parallel beta-helix repeat protein